MKTVQVRLLPLAIGVVVMMTSMRSVAKVTIDTASQERMTQQLIGKVSGLEQMRETLALAQHDIDRLDEELRAIEVQAEYIKSPQLNEVLRGLRERKEHERRVRVERLSALSTAAESEQMEPFYAYAHEVLAKAAPLLAEFPDRTGEFSIEQRARKEIGIRSAEAAISDRAAQFLKSAQTVHAAMSTVVAASLEKGAAIGNYFNGFFEYAKAKKMVGEQQRDDLWRLMAWLMLDYLATEGAPGRRTIEDTVRTVRRDNGRGESFETLMKYIPAKFRCSQQSLLRPHADWGVLLQEARAADTNAIKSGNKEEATAIAKCAFLLLQVSMWSATLLLGNKEIARAKDIALDGELAKVREKLIEVGMDGAADAQTVTQVQALVTKRLQETKALKEEGDAAVYQERVEQDAELVELSVRVHQLADEFTASMSHVTTADREVQELVRETVPAQSVTASAHQASTATADESFDDEELAEDIESSKMAVPKDADGKSWVKIALIIAGAALAAAKLYSLAVDKGVMQSKKLRGHDLKERIDQMFAFMNSTGIAAGAVVGKKVKDLLPARVKGWFTA